MKESFIMLKKGFTLVEILIVMSVVAILVAIIIPSYRAMQNEAWIAKAEKELNTLQVAIEFYYRHHDSYPANIADLLTTSPAIITRAPADPWKTGVTDPDTGVTTYGYLKGMAPGIGDYYLVYTQGMDMMITDTLSPINGRITIPDDSSILAVSNAPIYRN